MGFFDSLRQASSESPGRVMKIFLKSAIPEIALMNNSTRGDVLRKFCEKREGLLSELSNMTIEGVLKTSKNFTVAGNRLKKTAPVEGYPLLLTGLWLESRYRPGPDAAEVQSYLDELAQQQGGSVSI